MDSFSFDPETHTYTLNGKTISSVTQILKQEGFIDYSNCPAELLKEAEYRGNYVHRACELWNKGTLGLNSFKPEFLPYLEGWIKFVSDNKLTVIESELSTYSKTWAYGCTLDNVSIFRDNIRLSNGIQVKANTLAIIDLKTTSVIQPSVRYQLQGYKSAYEERRLKKGVLRIALRLTAKGEANPKIYTDPKDERDWLSIVSCNQIKRKLNLIRGE